MASKRGTFTLTVVNEHDVIFYGDCHVLFVPGQRDIVAIMPEHTPMIMRLSKGDVIVQNHHDKRLLTKITTGLLYVGDDEATVLVDI